MFRRFVCRCALLGLALGCLSACTGTTDGSADEGAGGTGNNDVRPCEDEQRFASEVIESSFGGGQNFGQEDFPSNVLGGPKGGGLTQGSLDVVSLGDGGQVVLGFSGAVLVDGPGPDLLVFENPFFVGGDEKNPLAERGQVAVSEDGETWLTFPCSATSYPYGSCAGWHPVVANVETGVGDPFEPDEAGGDPFDLADVGLERARFVRIGDVAGDGVEFDLDAVAIVNASCP